LMTSIPVIHKQKLEYFIDGGFSNLKFARVILSGACWKYLC
jgi:hypothetical protein